jgi:hypothetical protein
MGEGMALTGTPFSIPAVGGDVRNWGIIVGFRPCLITRPNTIGKPSSG